MYKEGFTKVVQKFKKLLTWLEETRENFGFYLITRQILSFHPQNGSPKAVVEISYSTSSPTWRVPELDHFSVFEQPSFL